MELPSERSILRFLISEDDRHGGKPLYEWIVVKALENGLAGATVLRGMMGFGASGMLHSFKIQRRAQDTPVVVEIVDLRIHLKSFLESIGETIGEGMFILKDSDIRHYRAGK